jgi:glucose-6-phosphate 1-dehydrogenase
VVFHRPPPLTFLNGAAASEANQVVLRVDPDPGLLVQLLTKGSDQHAWQPVHLGLSFAQELGQPLEPYERLLADAMAGERRLFTRQDSVEQTWRVVQPLLEDPPAPLRYAAGSWGPEQAKYVTRGYAGWHDPWVPQRPPGQDATGSRDDGETRSAGAEPGGRRA